MDEEIIPDPPLLHPSFTHRKDVNEKAEERQRDWHRNGCESSYEETDSQIDWQ